MPSLLDLSAEIRNDIYQLVLLHDKPLDVSGYSPIFSGPQGTALLRTNKQIHQEASAFLYGQNTFAVHDMLASFLDQIGKTNAASIPRLIIDFPSIIHHLPGDIWYINEADVGMLVQMREHCTSLHTLTASLIPNTGAENTLSNLDEHAIARGLLGLVDKRLRAIPSLRDIILEIDEDAPSEKLSEEVVKLGWTFKITKTNYFEDDWRDRDEWGEDEYWHSERSDDLHDDDYDIDNDSDFWRRADD